MKITKIQKSSFSKYTWKHEILEGFRSSSAGVHEQDVRLHQGLLSARAPQPQLPVVLVVGRHGDYYLTWGYPCLCVRYFPAHETKVDRK